MTHGPVLARSCMDLGAIQRHVFEANQPCPQADLEDLHRQIRQGMEVATTEIADAAVFRLLVASLVWSPDVASSPQVFLICGNIGQPDGLRAQKQHHHHSLLLRLLAAETLPSVDVIDLAQMQLNGKF